MLKSFEGPAMKPTPNYIIPLAFSALAVIQTGADAAAYIKYDGIDGEVTEAKYKGAIELTAWGWQLSESAEPAVPIVRPIELTKQADSTTPKLHEFLLNGKRAPTATIAFTVGTGQDEFEYMKVEMTNVMISSYSMSGSGAEKSTETVSLNFDSYCVTSSYIDPATGGIITTEPACWKSQ